MITSYKCSIIHLDKLIEGMAHISIIRVHNSRKCIRQRHIRCIHGKCHVCLMSIIHLMAGSHKNIVSISRHSGRTGTKRKCCICPEKATGALRLPVLRILCQPIDFFCIISFLVVCSGKDVIIIISLIECSENRKAQL